MYITAKEHYLTVGQPASRIINLQAVGQRCAYTRSPTPVSAGAPIYFTQIVARVAHHGNHEETVAGVGGGDVARMAQLTLPSSKFSIVLYHNKITIPETT